MKIAVLSAMQTLFFKRSFITVRAGLRESDRGVVDQAAKAVESLYFPHAFDPLARIVRESQEPSVRASAIRALSHVDTVEAAEFLFGILDHGTPTDRATAMTALKSSRGMRFLEIARASMASSGPELQGSLRELLRARGIAA